MSIEKRDDTGFEAEAKLESLMETANVEARLAERSWNDAVQHAIAAGQALIEAKAMTQGQWLPLLRESFDGSVRTAQRYMQVARNASSVSHLPTVRDAIALLADPKPKTETASDGPGRSLDDPGGWSAEWEAMSTDARRALLEATRVMLDAQIREAKANGDEYVDVPRWTLEPLMFMLKHDYQLWKAAAAGNLLVREQLEKRYRRQGKRIVWSSAA